MASNVSRGAYYKSRTRKWLLAQGYQVAEMELVHWLFTPKGRIPVKRDQFGSDLLAMSATEIIFVQVKSGEAARGMGVFPSARRVFEQYTFPSASQQWVVAWTPRAREPRIVNLTIVHLERTGTHVQKAESRETQEKAEGQGRQRQRHAQGSRKDTALTNTPRHGADPR